MTQQATAGATPQQASATPAGIALPSQIPTDSRIPTPVQGLPSATGAPQANQFTDAASAQALVGQSLTQGQTTANRANQSNPFGSLNWSVNPSTGQWSQNVSLTGPQGDALGSQQNVQAGRSVGAQGLLPQAVNNLQSPLDRSKFTGLFDFGAPGQVNQQAQDAVMGQLQPQIDQRRKAVETQLANQGITRGSEAWTNAEDQLARDENNAHLQGVQAGFRQGNEQNTQNISYGDYRTGLRRTQTGEAQTDRQQPLSDINSLLSGQGVSAPTFGAYGQAGVSAAPNYLGAQQSNYNANLDSLNLSADQRASFNNGLFSLGGAFLNSGTGQKWLGSAGDYLGSLFGGGGG